MIVILNRSIHMNLSNFCLFTKKSHENIVILVKSSKRFVFKLQYNEGAERRRQWEKWAGGRSSSSAERQCKETKNLGIDEY